MAAREETAHRSTLPFPVPSSTPADNSGLSSGDREFLLQLQRQSLQYFLDNQVRTGLILDRQDNHGPLRPGGLCSLTATGMGFIALALASAPPYCLLTPAAAARRIESGLRTGLSELPQDHGVMPHFVDAVTGAIFGGDYLSTIESAWFVTGGLWAAAFLGDQALQALAEQLFARIDFRYWTAAGRGTRDAGRGTRDARPAPRAPRPALHLLRHGMDRHGQFLPYCWDRLNGETIFMYILAAGAESDRALPGAVWSELKAYYGDVAGLRFNNADLGLFVFQYGLDLLDAWSWQGPSPIDLAGEAQLATWANERACADLAGHYRTYRTLWGISAGDGPPSAGPDVYRCYAPAGPCDGTAHVTASLASVAHHPAGVLDNLRRARQMQRQQPLGRYGFSNVNRDWNWISRDMVGIDAGAAVLALDNFLWDNRVRKGFHALPWVQRGLASLGFSRKGENERQRRAG
jgi:hypothetical protein